MESGSRIEYPLHAGISHYISTYNSASQLVEAESGRNFVFFERFQTRGNWLGIFSTARELARQRLYPNS